MAHTKRTLLTLFCWCSLSNILCAQIAPANSMRLYRTQSGHYAFHTLLNDRVLSSVMIESGIHAALIDSAFIHKHQHELGLTIRPNNMNKEINLGGTVYRITHRAKGNLKMNGCVYEGEFLVLSHYRNETEVTIPIQRLRQKDDWGSRIVMLDIKNNQMRMLTRNELRSWDCPRHKMNHRSYMRMPAISTTIAIDNLGNVKYQKLLNALYNNKKPSMVLGIGQNNMLEVNRARSDDFKVANKVLGTFNGETSQIQIRIYNCTPEDTKAIESSYNVLKMAKVSQ